MRPTNKSMKRLSLYLFLILFTFQTPSQADDIRDFQIEGMSVGDSLLTYLDKKFIKENTDYFYSVKKYGTVSIYKSKEYDRIQFTYDTTDENFEIHGIAAVLTFHNDIKGCKKKMNEVLNDVESIFGNNVDKQTGSEKRREDKTGKSIMYYNDFQFSDQSAINIYCTDWSKEITDKNNWSDELKISLYSVEFANYL